MSSIRPAIVVVMCIGLAACSAGEGTLDERTPLRIAAVATPTPAPLPTYTPTPQVPEGLFKLTVDTGLPAAESFLSRLTSHDFEGIARDAVFAPIGCGDPASSVIQPRPICELGEPSGSSVEALLLSGCEPGFIRPGEANRIADSLELLFTGTGPYLDSVWRVQSSPAGYTRHLGDAFAIVLVTGRGLQTAAWIVYLDEHGNLSGRTACGDYRRPSDDAIKIFPS